MSALSNQGPNAAASDFNLFMTYFMSQITQIQTVSLVRVEACTNAGGIVPAGTVDVTVLTNIMGANRAAIPHGTIYGLPYGRLQGGANAVIIDPQPGDIGIALFCSRDISIVKKTKTQANPGSHRMFDWADGVYIGGFLNGVPTQYVAFTESGIRVVSPGTITLHAPTVAVEGNLTISGATAGQGEGTFNGIPVSTHVHPGVQLGSSDTPGPIPP